MAPPSSSQLQIWTCGHPWSSPCRRGRGCGSGPPYQPSDSVGQTGEGRKAFCLFSLFLQERAEVWTPVEAGLTGLEETAGLSPCPAGGSSHSPASGREREGAAPHSPVTFQVGHFPEPRCLLMSWGGRLSALYPSSGPHITLAPRGWPMASRLWLQAHALCQPGLSGQLVYRCQPGASP